MGVNDEREEKDPRGREVDNPPTSRLWMRHDNMLPVELRDICLCKRRYPVTLDSLTAKFS
jgi:hypothetical protein